MSTSTEHARLLRLATRASVGVASILIIGKAVAWWFSGSVSMLAGLTDSLLDGVTSLLNLLAVHYALRPADDDHRYGHGKAESLAGMAQALFIAGSAVLIAFQAYQRLQHPEPVGAPWLSIAVIVLSLALTDPGQLDQFLSFADNPLVKFAEFGLVFLLAMHFFGGLRLLALEFLPWSQRQKSLAAGAIAGAFLISGTFLLRAV